MMRKQVQVQQFHFSIWYGKVKSWKKKTFTEMTTNTFVPFVLCISLHLSPASHSSHFCPLLCFFAPNIAHIFPQMPWADYNSSSALPLSPLTPSRCCVGSVINDIDTALDSWLHRASCWTTYWDDTHIRVNKYTLARKTQTAQGKVWLKILLGLLH